MTIYIGADHRGFDLKERIKEFLKSETYDVVDVGAIQPAPADDFPDFAAAVAEKVSKGGDQVKGILICGSGFGMDIAANKFPGVRAALPMSPDHIYQGRHDDDVNVLSIATNFMDDDTAIKVVKVFLSTPFGKEERYVRRLGKITAIEEKNQEAK